MLVAIFRANEDAFIRGNVNLVRTGRILNIPEPDAIGTIDREEANRLVKEQHDQWMEYRSRLAAVPAPAEAAAPQQEAAGRIEPKPEKRAGAKPAPVPPVAQAPAQQPAAPAKPEAPKPAAEAPKPAAEAPPPAPAAPKPAAPAPKPAAKKVAPPPEPSIIDEFLD